MFDFSCCAALLSHLRSRKGASKAPAPLAKVVDFEGVDAADADDFPEPVAPQKPSARTRTPPRARASSATAKGVRSPPRSAGKRKTPSKSTTSRSRLRLGEAGEGEAKQETSDSEGEATGAQAGESTQPEGGDAFSPKYVIFRFVCV